ncbi:MAG: MFS transporter [Planctomycetota bacterium]|nr:MFS transporter [Planctomycetota bacterium]
MSAPSTAADQTPTSAASPNGGPSRPTWAILLSHGLGVTLLQSTQMAIWFVFPVLARKRFEANDWQTLIVTASSSVLFALSIFWNDLFSRRSFASYLKTWWVVACVPLALCALAVDYWTLLVPYVISCMGVAGYHPAGGDLLKSLYPAATRGRVYSAMWGASMVFGALMGWGVGEWLEIDHNAFRYYLPAAAGLQLAGIWVFIRLSHRTGHGAGRVMAPARGAGLLKRLVEPISHAKEVLRTDRVFARYEAAYMTYGVGWMIAYALLPMLVTDRLNLKYDEIAFSTQTVYLLALVACLWPAGLLMDRLGPVRSTGLSFGMLAVYPMLYLWADDTYGLSIASLVYGAAHAGASVGWMLGPVALAPTPEKVPQYVAIHATLVGVRGKLFQLLGVGLYMALGDFRVPLVIASLAYVWSCVQMFQLDRVMARTKKAGEIGMAPAPTRGAA